MAESNKSGSMEKTKSVFENGAYKNPWEGFIQLGFLDFSKIMMSESSNRHRLDSKEILKKELPVREVDQKEVEKSPETGIRGTWLGHASVLAQFDGVSVLTDPVFSHRCGMQTFLGQIGLARFRESPVTVEKLPHVDAVVISHNHYDHLDTPTILKLKKKFGDSLEWFVPKGNKSWFENSGIQNVKEMDWWEETTLSGRKDIKFVCTPTQHFSNRGLTDRNKTLWCSWVVKGPTSSFFFGGDTAYCKAFKQIGHFYGPFNLSAIPIGAYEPRGVMKYIHVNPAEAVEIHKDINSKKSIGIHWATFVLTYEHYMAPKLDLIKALQEQNIPLEDFITLEHGESRLFE